MGTLTIEPAALRSGLRGDTSAPACHGDVSPVWAIRGWLSPGSFVDGRICAFRDLDSSGYQAGWIAVSDGGPDAYFRPWQLDRVLSGLLAQDPSGHHLLGQEVRFRLEYRRSGQHRQAGGVVLSPSSLGRPLGLEGERALGVAAAGSSRAAGAVSAGVAAGSSRASGALSHALGWFARSRGDLSRPFAPTDTAVRWVPLVPVGGVCVLCLASTGWVEPHGVLCVACGGRGAPGTSAWALGGALSQAAKEEMDG